MFTVREKVSGVERGNVYGSIEVLGNPFSAGRNTEGRRLYLAVCRCGKCGEVKTFRVGCLRQGNSRGCQDCFDREQLTTGGDRSRKVPLNTCWAMMRNRCFNKRAGDFKHYGGRGIRICLAWNDYMQFKEWALANGYQPGLEIDRIDNDGDYEPINCHWVTRSENNRNKRNNVMVSAFGETKCIAAWLDDRRCKVTKWLTLRDRLRSGWSPERAITTEVKSATVV